MTTVHTTAPAWDGNLSQLSNEDLWKRDRALADHIALTLAHYDATSCNFRPATQTEQARGELNRWIRALVEVRNELERRSRPLRHRTHQD